MAGVSTTQQLSGHLVRDYDHLIATLVARRNSQGLNNAEVAQRIPIDRASVSRWLCGVNEPLAGRLVDLVHALGCDLAVIPREDA